MEPENKQPETWDAIAIRAKEAVEVSEKNVEINQAILEVANKHLKKK